MANLERMKVLLELEDYLVNNLKEIVDGAKVGEDIVVLRN